MPYITHTATFDPGQAPAGMLEDLVCPACGCAEQCNPDTALADRQLRFFCDNCGAFVTVSLTDEQAEAVREWSGSRGRARLG